MDPKPNIHYIGVIENDGERVVYKKYPIELPRSLLDSLDSMQDNAEKTVLDMQSEVERYYPLDERGRFLSDYLAPRYYTDTYVGCTYFPKIVTAQEFEYNKSITVREAVAQYDKYVEERRVNGSTSLGKTRDAYVAEKEASWIRANKVAYRTEMRRYICSHSYYAASRKAGLTKRLNADVKMFGFGRRSYFQLGLIYRGIEIFPYSAYVRYYFANWRTLIAHTRSYELQRRSWDYALEFVAEHANAAATDPVWFVNEFILGEVKKMMDGLRGIVRMTPAQFHEEMNPQHETRTRYLGVSAPDKNSIVCYQAYPNEMLIAYKAEKIGGALTFLEKLKQLGEIHVEVNQAVQEIMKLVMGIVPELEQNIDGIATDIMRREEELSGLRTKMMPLQTQISQMNDEIAKLQEAALAVLAPPWAMTSDSTRVAIRSNVRILYLQQHPEYGQISVILSQYQVKCKCILGDIANRKKFSDRLSNCKNVAQGAGAYERVVDALRPHEREIERLLVVELGDKCVEDVDPKTLKDMRSKVADKYYAEHADYANLVTRRDVVEHMMDAFEVMKVR